MPADASARPGASAASFSYLNSALPGSGGSVDVPNSNVHHPSGTPAAPTTSSVSSGSLAAATPYVKVTYVVLNGIAPGINGESAASAATSQSLAANHVLLVTSPVTPTLPAYADHYNVYVDPVNNGAGPFYLQNTSGPVTLGTSWQEPNTGFLSSGATAPTVDTTSGYITPLVTFTYLIGGQPVPFYKGMPAVVSPYIRAQMIAQGGLVT